MTVSDMSPPGHIIDATVRVVTLNILLGPDTPAPSSFVRATGTSIGSVAVFGDGHAWRPIRSDGSQRYREREIFEDKPDYFSQSRAASSNARSAIRASPQISFVMLKANACPLGSARVTSKPLIVA